MHVDGFRFDLASALARGFHEVERLSAFFDLIHQDPVVSQVKLIAEPWDVGEGGYQVGNFPVLWTEWNGRYRDTIRDFWRGARTGVADLAYRLTGSSDLYQSDGRRPYASINFVTAHDGFTLHDLVSYEHKRNQANGEGNRDGSDDNRSWNCGVEGPSGDPEVVALRERQKRNLLATLLLSSGVPMLLAGDEMGRTQQGNNNAYCQDNEISWVDWSLDERKVALLEHARALIALRNAHPVFRRRRFFQGQAIHGSGVKDIGWFTPDGAEMDDARWRAPDIATLGVFLNGEEIPDRSRRGERIVDDSFLLLLHGDAEERAFTLPGLPWAKEYELVFHTMIDRTDPDDEPTVYLAGEGIQMLPRSLAFLRKRS
jgi:glycogen operon protein